MKHHSNIMGDIPRVITNTFSETNRHLIFKDVLIKREGGGTQAYSFPKMFRFVIRLQNIFIIVFAFTAWLRAASSVCAH